MLTMNQALANIAIMFAASGGLGAASYYLKGYFHDDYDKEFFKGTFLGTLKLLFIYLLITPIILASPAPIAVLNIFRLILMGLVIILVIELFVYILTHMVKTEKELFVIGVLGGITRSEAVIAEFLEELRENNSLIEETILVILIASTTMVFRNLVILAVVLFELFLIVAIPLLALGIASIFLIYFTYKKTEVEDITLKAVSLRTAFEIVFIFTIITAVAEYLAGFSNPILLYLVAVFGALGGALPIVFSVITLLSFGRIELAVGATMIILASAVAYMDDAFLSILFKQKELAKDLAIKQIPLSAAAILLYFFLSGQLQTLTLPTGIPWHYYLVPLPLILLAIIIMKLRGRRERMGIQGGQPDMAPSDIPGPGQEGPGPEPEKEQEKEPEPGKGPEQEQEPEQEPEQEKEPEKEPEPEPEKGQEPEKKE